MSAAREHTIETRIGRGDRVESLHRAVAVAIPRGGTPILFGAEDPGSFLRSVAKPFQTLALFRAGVIDHHGLLDEEVAVITASHGGEPEHRRRVDGILRRGGFTADDLRCGTHAPFTASERRRMAIAGEVPDALSNNCSGKHAGMLLHAARIGDDPGRYLDPDHPVQRAVFQILASFLGIDMHEAPRGTDGCGAPTWFTSLTAIARAYSRLGDGEFLDELGLRPAVERLHSVLWSSPLLFSGEQRFPYLWSPFLAPDLLAKEGAEGVFVAWGARGALALKSLDGQERGYRYAVPVLLDHLGWLAPGTLRRWQTADPPVVQNVVGRVVGKIEVVLPR